ncbi:MAG: hypothetical protein QW251_03655 [Desulfurococcaceae archaeon]
MGIKYICGNCGYVLYEFSRTGSSIGLLSPRDIAKMYKNACPRCGKELTMPNPATWKHHIIVKVIR